MSSAEIVNLNNHQMTTQDSLDSAKELADQVDAHAAIVLLVHGESDELVVHSSHSFRFAQMAGILEQAKHAAAFETMIDAEDFEGNEE